jgi:hypothetical protein
MRCLFRLKSYSVAVNRTRSNAVSLLSIMSKPNSLLSTLAVTGAFVAFAQNALCLGPLINTGNLYQDSTSFQSANLNLGNAQLGNEIDLASGAPNDWITSFSFQYDFIATSKYASPTGNETADVTFYENNGPVIDGYKSPGSEVYSSGPINIGGAGYTPGYTIDFFKSDINGGAGVVVPQDFTWTVTFAGLTSCETAGLALYSPATVGNNYNDAWINDSWGLYTAISNQPALDFGSVFNGCATTNNVSSVPDSSCLPVSVLSVMAMFGWMKRFQRKA